MKKYEVVTTLSYPKRGAMGRTGSWRVFRPVLDENKCVRCLRCWIFCPESSITRLDDDSVRIDYDYCKGCGICARECPAKAIRMEREGQK